MEDAGTSEEDDDIDSQDSNIPIDHGHLARNCSIKISEDDLIRTKHVRFQNNVIVIGTEI